MKFLSLNISIFLLFLEPGNIFLNRVNVCSDTRMGKLCSTITPVNNTSAFVTLISGFSVTQNLKREEVAVLLKADLGHHQDLYRHTINQFCITHKRNNCSPVLAFIQVLLACPALFLIRKKFVFLGLSCVLNVFNFVRWIIFFILIHACQMNKFNLV